MFEIELYILDLIGTFAFSVYGTYFALKKNLDIFGVFVAAFLSAVGGGTIREMMLNHTPFYFYDNAYFLTIVGGVVFTISIYKHFNNIKPLATLLDSIGLVTFAFIGATKGAGLELGFFPIIFFATITAVGGGILRDIVLNKVPSVVYYDCYAFIAILLGTFYAIFEKYMEDVLWINLLLLCCLIMRLLVIQFKINLWNPSFGKKKLSKT